MLLAQGVQLLGLARCLQRCGEAEGLGDFCFQQQVEQFIERNGGIGIDPFQGQQGQGGRARVADFRVIELAGAKQAPLAHDEAHEQGARGLRQCAEGGNELRFFWTQQIGVTRADPAQHVLEIIQIVQGIFQDSQHGDGNRARCKVMVFTVFIYSLNLQPPLAQRFYVQSAVL
ncbi:hypothetical protein D3C72_1511170 [compost metagenome]